MPSLPTLARRTRRNLAVSTVIGTVLMTTLTITLGTLVVIWASQTFGVYQGSAGIYFNSRAAALRETLAVEDIWFYSSSQSNCWTQSTSGSYRCINVTVRNTGTIDLKVSAIYVNSTSMGSSGTTVTPTLPVTITVGGSQTFKIIYNQAWGSTTKAYFIQVATARGNQVSTFWGYP